MQEAELVVSLAVEIFKRLLWEPQCLYQCTERSACVSYGSRNLDKGNGWLKSTYQVRASEISSHLFDVLSRLH